MITPDHRGNGEAGRFEQQNLFEPPPFSPTYPKRSTLAGQALALLLAGRALTHPDFENITLSWRLSEPIRALRHEHGWPVQTVEIHSPTAERPDRIIAKYVMPSWVIKEIGELAHG